MPLTMRGLNRVRLWLADPDVSQDGELVAIPYPETENYVKKVVKAAAEYREALRYRVTEGILGGRSMRKIDVGGLTLLLTAARSKLVGLDFAAACADLPAAGSCDVGEAFGGA